VPSAAQSVLWLLSLALERKLPGCRPGSTVLIFVFILTDCLTIKDKTDGLRPVRRLTFFNAKKVSKKADLLRRALLVPGIGVLFNCNR
jgi:hypothetical protein